MQPEDISRNYLIGIIELVIPDKGVVAPIAGLLADIYADVVAAGVCDGEAHHLRGIGVKPAIDIG